MIFFTKKWILPLLLVIISIQLKAQLFCSSDTLTYSVNPWGCEAYIGPDPICDVMGNAESYEYEPHTVALSEGCVDVTVSAVIDGISYQDIVTVCAIDATAPVAISKVEVLYQLTSSGENPNENSVKVYASQVDNGSHDGDCGPVRIAIRRESGLGCGNIGDSGYNNNLSYYDFDNFGQGALPLFHNGNDTDEGDFVQFCGADITDYDPTEDVWYGVHRVWIGVWDDGNQDGIPGNKGDNFNETWSNIRVISNEAPQLLDTLQTSLCLENALLACSIDFNDPVVIDSIGKPEFLNCVGGETYNDTPFYDVNGDGISSSDFYYEGFIINESYDPVCKNGMIFRTWYNCDSTETCEQLILVKPDANLFDGNEDIDWPYSLNSFANIISNDGANQCNGFGFSSNITEEDITLLPDSNNPTSAYITVDCWDELCEEPIWDESSCSLIGISSEERMFYFENNQCLRKIVTYTVVNWCEYDPTDPDSEGIWNWTVELVLEDNTPPEIETENTVTLSNCELSNLPLSAIADDSGCNSSFSWNKWVVLIDLEENGAVDLEYSSFIEEDGPSDLWDDDNNNGIPDIDLGNSILNISNLSAEQQSLNGEAFRINLPEWVEYDSTKRHEVTWTAYDQCGNVTQFTSYFIVSGHGNDEVAPTPYCINNSNAISNQYDSNGAYVILYASDFDAGSFDNCTDYEDLRFTFSDVAPEEDLSFDPNFNTSELKIYESDTDDGEISIAIYVWDEAGNFNNCLVSLNLVQQPCVGTNEENIIWPLTDINILQSGINSGNTNLVSPDSLIANFGFSQAQVTFIFQNPSCGSNYSSFFSDEFVMQPGGDLYGIVFRTWTVINIITNETSTFQQMIRLYEDDLFICDFLPNSAPVGDCESGHTLSDDVEWPDDIAIADHRITPDELTSFSGIPIEDTRPVLNNSNNLYSYSYTDFLEDLNQDELIFKRAWNVERIGLEGLSWNYDQLISVDLEMLTNIVSVHTVGHRPFPNLYINNQLSTDLNGIAVVSEDSEVNPSYEDAVYNGVNIKDLVLLQDYLLGAFEFNSVEHQTVADLNEDNFLDSEDLLELKEVILGKEIDIVPEQTWSFENITSQSLQWGNSADSYLALKKGDIDDNAELIDPVIFPLEAIILEDVLINAGQLYETEIRIETGFDMLGYELHLDYDSEYLEIINISSGVSVELESNNTNDKIHILATESTQISPNETLATVIFRAKQNTILNKVLKLTSDRKSFILDGNKELIELNLDIEGEIISNTKDSPLETVGLFPNPVSDVLYITGLDNQEISDFTLELFNINGQHILTSNRHQSIDLSKFDSGVYTYKIVFKESYKTGKIIKM